MLLVLFPVLLHNRPDAEVIWTVYRGSRPAACTQKRKEPPEEDQSGGGSDRRPIAPA